MKTKCVFVTEKCMHNLKRRGVLFIAQQLVLARNAIHNKLMELQLHGQKLNQLKKQVLDKVDECAHW